MIIEQGTTKFELTKPEVESLITILLFAERDISRFQSPDEKISYFGRTVVWSEIHQFIKQMKELLQ